MLAVTAALTFFAFANPYHVTNRFPVPGDGSWDYVTLDAKTRRLYISHATQVDVIHADTGKSIGTIPDTPGVHGIAVVQKHNVGFTTNGRENKVSVFNLKTLALIRKLDVGKGPDGIFYHPATDRIFTCNHGSHDISVIDAGKTEVIGTVKLQGDGESMIAATDGLLYVNVEDTAEVAAFDPKTLEVRHRYPLGVAQTPTGLAYDPKTNHLFIGCRKKPTLVVMDAATGRVVHTLPIGGNVDWAHWDPASRTVFTSNGEGNLSVFAQKSGGTYEDLGPVATQPSGKTMAFDPKTGRIFVPAAEVETAPVRKIQPGTFQILVIGK